MGPVSSYHSVSHSLPFPEDLQVKNQATHIPPEAFNELVGFLQMHSTEMKQAIASGTLLNQTNLNLSSCELEELPDCIGHLTNLTTLNASNNQLEGLPETIGLLVNLTELYLNGNRLTTLPQSIDRLTNLSGLYIGNNQFSSLPDTIGQLTHLIEIYLFDNDLRTLPPSIGGLTQLRKMVLLRNSNLSILPLSLGNCPQLTSLMTEGTQIPRSIREQTVTHGKKIPTLAEKFSCKIALWKKAAGLTEEWMGPKLKEEEKKNLYTWLIRLERAKDFKCDQKGLAETTCAILKDIYEDPKFRERFFNLIVADLTRCGDRAAMSLNLVYTEWKLHTLQTDAPLSTRVELLVGCSRTLELRRAVLKKYLGLENVEKVLYAETNLGERLALVTAVHSMLHEKIGKIPAEELEEIAAEIEKIPRAKLIARFDYWRGYLKEHHTLKFFTIESRTQAAQGGLLRRRQSEDIQEMEYLSQNKALKEQEEEAILRLTEEIITGIFS
ncbi:MAG: hypothetical protein S4CHLAM45_10010 [Chlamydiales bacterium]|nr:hypothetical protein [Chlamydiales bacterium]MCH9620183.1 hypothetical protein [Chlamydiales bacterium]MCH9623102.1 hypothetical protein [Chlamydiales bacterium]